VSAGPPVTEAALIDGAAIAGALRQRIGAAVTALRQAHGITPGLAAVLVGDDPASQVYVRSKARACAAAGIASFEHRLPADSTAAAILDLIARLNADEQVDGILVQLPLPRGIDPRAIIGALDPAKDVDGFHPLNVGRLWSGEPVRFLAVLVVATPCPLLIGIPVAIIGAISLAAKRGIIIRDPAVLERIDRCRTVILDKTGTLTYGEPTLTDRLVAPGMDDAVVLRSAASLERYSKHPLAKPILDAAAQQHLAPVDASEVRERPGEGLEGDVDGRQVRVLGRHRAAAMGYGSTLPPASTGLECVILLDGQYAATYRFHDAPRADSQSFITHLRPRHRLERVLLVSGDRESEVRYLADRVGIQAIYAGQTPEQKVAITQEETRRAPTLFIGDGINDAPALVTATVGLAFGHHSEITTEAAGAVIMDTSLKRVDELFHLARRMRRIALQSAIGGMALSILGMFIAFGGWLPPVGGAVFQEIIDLAAVVNALRAAVPGGTLSDY